MFKLNWDDYQGRYKNPTVLLYDSEYKNVLSWGYSAFEERINRRRRQSNSNRKPVELFKLHFLNSQNKPPLPNGLDYRKATTDYLRELGKVIKHSLNDTWGNVIFETRVLIVLAVNKFNYKFCCKFV
jgi:hypothetical protein